MTAHLIPCSCCRGDTDEETAYVDPDLKTPVCPSCKVDLRWAHARLCEKRNGVPLYGIEGCVQE